MTRRTVPPSAEIEEQIDRLLAVGVGENPRQSLSELAKLAARLIIERAVEDEFDGLSGDFANPGVAVISRRGVDPLLTRERPAHRIHVAGVAEHFRTRFMRLASMRDMPC